MKILINAITTVFLLGIAAAHADTKLVYVDENSGEVRSVIAIKDGMVRMDNKDQQNWVLYDSSSETITAVDAANRSYSVIDEETMQQISKQVSDAMAKMEEQLANVPAEQREAMKKMMGGMMDMGKKSLETSVERTGRSMSKAGYDCDEVIFSVGTITRTTLCVVEDGELGLDSDDQVALDNMYAAMNRFTETIGKGIGMSYSLPDIGGIPVYSKEDKERTGEILKEATDDDLDSGLFEVPSGFREEKMTMR